MKMQADRTAPVSRPPTVRSKATNGKSLFASGGDGRGPWARRMRDLLELHVADKGGHNNISEAEHAILRRASVLIVELERMESAFSQTDGAPDVTTLDAYQRAANSLRRLLESVGLERRARDVTPTLDAHEAEQRRHEIEQIDAPLPP